MKSLMTIMLVALCVSFASCSDKDQPVNNELEDRGIIGEWSYKNPSSSTEYRYVFKADGTSVLTFYTDGVPGPKENYTYTYDKITSIGKLTQINGPAIFTFKYEAGVINIYDVSGKISETYSWFAPLPKDPGIVGEWSYSEDSYKKRIMTFNNDGTLIIRILVNNIEDYKANFKYSFEAKTSIGKILDDGGNTIHLFKYIDNKIILYFADSLTYTYVRESLSK